MAILEVDKVSDFGKHMLLSLGDVHCKSRFQVSEGEAAKVVKMRRGKRRLLDKADRVYVSSVFMTLSIYIDGNSPCSKLTHVSHYTHIRQ